MGPSLTQEEVQDRFECSICLCVFIKPILTICGHEFCDDCLTRSIVMNNRRVCPLDNTELHRGDVFPNKRKEREIQQNSAICPRCKEDKIPLRNYDNHVLACDGFGSLCPEQRSRSPLKNEETSQNALRRMDTAHQNHVSRRAPYMPSRDPSTSNANSSTRTAYSSRAINSMLVPDYPAVATAASLSTRHPVPNYPAVAEAASLSTRQYANNHHSSLALNSAYVSSQLVSSGNALVNPSSSQYSSLSAPVRRPSANFIHSTLEVNSAANSLNQLIGFYLGAGVAPMNPSNLSSGGQNMNCPVSVTQARNSGYEPGQLGHPVTASVNHSTLIMSPERVPNQPVHAGIAPVGNQNVNCPQHSTLKRNSAHSLNQLVGVYLGTAPGNSSGSQNGNCPHSAPARSSGFIPSYLVQPGNVSTNQRGQNNGNVPYNIFPDLFTSDSNLLGCCDHDRNPEVNFGDCNCSHVRNFY